MSPRISIMREGRKRGKIAKQKKPLGKNSVSTREAHNTQLRVIYLR